MDGIPHALRALPFCAEIGAIAMSKKHNVNNQPQKNGGEDENEQRTTCPGGGEAC